jgi:hypothetical protein
VAKKVDLVRIFLASPADVAEERKAAQEVVSELNLTLAPHLGVYLELITWETHSAPSFGADAQAVIEEQIGRDYDIFVGVFFKRFGSPTL